MYRILESDETEPPPPRNTGLAAIVALVFMVIGCFLGLRIADQDALPALQTKIAGMISADDSNPFANLKAAIAGIVGRKDAESKEQTASEAISTGVSSVGTIHYSPKPVLTQMIFDLEDVKLIRTGKLIDPHRVYFDLQNIHWEQDSFKGIQTLKALDIDGALVSRVRIKKRESGVTRVVLDLTQSCAFTYQVPQDSPSRLIVQLRPV